LTPFGSSTELTIRRTAFDAHGTAVRVRPIYRPKTKGPRVGDHWFYGRGSDISGPVSGMELAGLAAAGTVLPTDTVWADGAEDGIPAGQVPECYPPAAGPVAMAGTRPTTQRRGRAVAGKGVVLVGQDGATVKFRMKCTTCGREDSSWKTIPIPFGTTRTGFFCTKCRKRRDGEVHGYH
jgi:GYF domain 2